MNSVLGTAATRFGRLIVEETVRSPHSTKTVLPGRFGSFLTFPPSFATVALARTMHESPAATADLAVLPGVLGSRTLRRTKQVRLRSEPRGAAGRLPGGTAISTISRRRPVHSAGYPKAGISRRRQRPQVQEHPCES